VRDRLEFRRCDPAVPPASGLLADLLAEYDDGEPACGGGVKTLEPGVAEIKRMYVAPPFRGRGLGAALLGALEDRARAAGHHTVRLDSIERSWPLYVRAGYVEIPDYNENPHAAHWGEKRL
jgi:GNAT superfamily N-acetyltransferase